MTPRPGRGTPAALWILNALLAGLVLSFSACLPNGDDSEINVPNQNDPFANCLAVGAQCGGSRLCCQDTICKGGVCSRDPNCIGSGGHCATTGDCCGLGVCHNGVCDGGNCRQLGEHCEGSADCCGAGICNNGFCQ